MRVRAGSDGVLQELSLSGITLQVGQQVAAGTTIAKVVNPRRLKAELKIPETEARDIQIGQTGTVDTHNGMITGHVVRIDRRRQERQDGTFFWTLGVARIFFHPGRNSGFRQAFLARDGEAWHGARGSG
jgi:multidrug efflux pump subunit AcrA (membrane-fusion protein)